MAGKTIKFGEYDIDLSSFAQEETLRDLLAVMSGKGTSPAAKAKKQEEKATKDAAAALEDFGDQIDLTTDELDKASGELGKSLSSAGDKAGNMASRLIGGFENLAGSTSESGRALEKTADSMADIGGKALDAVDKLGSIGGPIGEAIVGAISGFGKLALQVGSAMVSFYVGQMEGLRARQREFYDSGVFFTNGIDDAATFAAQAGVTIGDLADASKDAKDALRFMAGSSAGGLGAVSKSLGKFTNEQKEQLIALGYTNEEMLANLSQLGSVAGEIGQKMSIEDLESQSVGYLNNLKALSKLTGEDVKSMQARKEAMRTDAVFQATMRRLNTDQQLALKDLVAGTEKFGPDFQNTLKRVLSGQTATTEMMLFKQQFPGVFDEMTKFKAALDSGTMSQKDVPAAIASIGDIAQAEGTKVADRFVRIQGAGSDLVDKFVETAGLLTATGNQIKLAGENIGDGLSPQGQLNKSIAEFVNINTQLQSSLQNIATTVTKSMGPTVTSIVDQLRELADQLPGVTASQQEKSRAKKGLQQQIKETNEGYGTNRTVGSYFSDPEYILEEEIFGDKYDSLTDEELKKMKVRREQSLGRTVYIYNPNMKALGGPVARGSDYLVGETGPEKFTPTESGTITPLKAVPVNINDQGMTSRLDSLISLNSAMLRAMERSNALTRQGQLLAS